MLQCEICSNWSYYECVKVSPAIADNHPYICPFCIKCYFSLVSNLRSEIHTSNLALLDLRNIALASLNPSQLSFCLFFHLHYHYLIPLISNHHLLPYSSCFIIPLLPCIFPLLFLHSLYLFNQLLLLLLPYPHPLPALYHSHLIIQLLLLLLSLLPLL